MHARHMARFSSFFQRAQALRLQVDERDTAIVLKEAHCNRPALLLPVIPQINVVINRFMVQVRRAEQSDGLRQRGVETQAVGKVVRIGGKAVVLVGTIDLERGENHLAFFPCRSPYFLVAKFGSEQQRQTARRMVNVLDRCFVVDRSRSDTVRTQIAVKIGALGRQAHVLLQFVYLHGCSLIFDFF